MGLFSVRGKGVPVAIYVLCENGCCAYVLVESDGGRSDRDALPSSKLGDVMKRLADAFYGRLCSQLAAIDREESTRATT